MAKIISTLCKNEEIEKTSSYVSPIARHQTKVLPELILQVVDLPIHALIRLDIVVELSLGLTQKSKTLKGCTYWDNNLSPVSLLSGDLLLSFIKLPSHGLHPPVCLKTNDEWMLVAGKNNVYRVIVTFSFCSLY